MNDAFYCSPRIASIPFDHNFPICGDRNYLSRIGKKSLHAPGTDTVRLWPATMPKARRILSAAFVALGETARRPWFLIGEGTPRQHVTPSWWLPRDDHFAYFGFVVLACLGIGILKITGREEGTTFGVMAQRIVRETDVAVGVGCGGIEFQHHC